MPLLGSGGQLYWDDGLGPTHKADRRTKFARAHYNGSVSHVGPAALDWNHNSNDRWNPFLAADWKIRRGNPREDTTRVYTAHRERDKDKVFFGQLGDIFLVPDHVHNYGRDADGNPQRRLEMDIRKMHVYFSDQDHGLIHHIGPWPVIPPAGAKIKRVEKYFHRPSMTWRWRSYCDGGGAPPQPTPPGTPGTPPPKPKPGPTTQSPGTPSPPPTPTGPTTQPTGGGTTPTGGGTTDPGTDYPGDGDTPWDDPGSPYYNPWGPVGYGPGPGYDPTNPWGLPQGPGDVHGGGGGGGMPGGGLNPNPGPTSGSGGNAPNGGQNGGTEPGETFDMRAEADEPEQKSPIARHSNQHIDDMYVSTRPTGYERSILGGFQMRAGFSLLPARLGRSLLGSPVPTTDPGELDAADTGRSFATSAFDAATRFTQDDTDSATEPDHRVQTADVQNALSDYVGTIAGIQRSHYVEAKTVTITAPGTTVSVSTTYAVDAGEVKVSLTPIDVANSELRTTNFSGGDGAVHSFDVAITTPLGADLEVDVVMVYQVARATTITAGV